MCGIVGVVGHPQAVEILVNGLKRLEYRGYDSAGIYLQDYQQLVKAVGPLKALEGKLTPEIKGTLGIGHTRWATHGKATEENAHPHTSETGDFILVHNGVIENYRELKEKYLSADHFYGETDSEIAVHLIAHFAKESASTKEAFKKALAVIEGSYAFGLIDASDNDTLYAAKNKSPLLIGLGADFNVIASDALAVLDYTTEFLEIHDGELAVLTAASVQLEDACGHEVKRESFVPEIDSNDLDKGTYPFYMLKEIDEQPMAIRRIVKEYLHEGQHITPALLAALKEADSINLVACGTSWHASRIGAHFFSEWVAKPASALLASEAGYRMPLFSAKPFFIFLSQSGETADSRQVLVRVKELGYPSLTITNVLGSTLARESDFALPILAGPEIAVASTKAYTAQIAVLACLAQALAPKEEQIDLARELSLVANGMDSLISEKETIAAQADQYLATTRNAFYIGRYMDYEVSLEAALKLKEISYIQAEGFAAGELKHGTIALIEEGTPVLAIINDPVTASHTRGNIQEVKSRGANVYTIVREDLAQAQDNLQVPVVNPLLSPLVSIVPAQLIAYYATLQRGLDVDKPRNLAKSVTVE